MLPEILTPVIQDSNGHLLTSSNAVLNPWTEHCRDSELADLPDLQEEVENVLTELLTQGGEETTKALPSHAEGHRTASQPPQESC